MTGFGGGGGNGGAVLALKPVIQILNPIGSPALVNTPGPQVTMMIYNVATASDIVLKVNNVQQTNGVSYNSATHLLSYTPNLSIGMNTISVTATNHTGNTGASMNIQYTPPGKIKH